MKTHYEQEACVFCEAIKAFANNPEALANMESYLTYHFSEWMKKWASSPADIAKELSEFANMTF